MKKPKFPTGHVAFIVMAISVLAATYYYAPTEGKMFILGLTVGLLITIFVLCFNVGRD